MDNGLLTTHITQYNHRKIIGHTTWEYLALRLLGGFGITVIWRYYLVTWWLTWLLGGLRLKGSASLDMISRELSGDASTEVGDTPADAYRRTSTTRRTS